MNYVLTIFGIVISFFFFAMSIRPPALAAVETAERMKIKALNTKWYIIGSALMFMLSIFCWWLL